MTGGDSAIKCINSAAPRHGAGVCVFKTASQFISLISAAFCAPIRSLTLQHIQSIGRKKEKKEGGAGGGRKIPLNLFCSLKEVHGKKKRENEIKSSFISVGNPNPRRGRGQKPN